MSQHPDKVITQTEKYEAMVRELAKTVFSDNTSVLTDTPEFATYIKRTAQLMLENDDKWYEGYKQGLVKGREESGAMFLDAFEAELTKYLAEETPGWRHELMGLAKRAVTAITQSQEKK